MKNENEWEHDNPPLRKWHIIVGFPFLVISELLYGARKLTCRVVGHKLADYREQRDFCNRCQRMVGDEDGS